jgi:hypothetical protein
MMHCKIRRGTLGGEMEAAPPDSHDTSIRAMRGQVFGGHRQASFATRGCSPGDPFDDDPHYGAALRPHSREQIRKGCGRWLCFLAARGWLDPLQPPLQRVTRERLRAYFHTLRGAGNADDTIIGRFVANTNVSSLNLIQGRVGRRRPRSL